MGKTTKCHEQYADFVVFPFWDSFRIQGIVLFLLLFLETFGLLDQVPSELSPAGVKRGVKSYWWQLIPPDYPSFIGNCVPIYKLVGPYLQSRRSLLVFCCSVESSSLVQICFGEVVIASWVWQLSHVQPAAVAVAGDAAEAGDCRLPGDRNPPQHQAEGSRQGQVQLENLFTEIRVTKGQLRQWACLVTQHFSQIMSLLKHIQLKSLIWTGNCLRSAHWVLTIDKEH